MIFSKRVTVTYNPNFSFRKFHANYHGAALYVYGICRELVRNDYQIEKHLSSRYPTSETKCVPLVSSEDYKHLLENYNEFVNLVASVVADNYKELTLTNTQSFQTLEKALVFEGVKLGEFRNDA